MTELLVDAELLTDPLELTVELWETNPVLEAVPELLCDIKALSDTIALAVGKLVTELLTDPELLDDTLALAKELWEATPVLDSTALLDGEEDTEALEELLTDSKALWDTIGVDDASAVLDTEALTDSVSIGDTVNCPDALTEPLTLPVSLGHRLGVTLGEDEPDPVLLALIDRV